MKIQSGRFNIYLLLSFLLLAAHGCQSTPEKKKHGREYSTLRLFMETSQSSSDRSGAVPIYRRQPIYVKVENAPFLDEGNIARAAVVNDVGGFSIQITFDAHGTLVLNSYTTANRGRRLAVFSQFTEARWLAAPQINGPIMNGSLVFTPDATREEAERIVLGLNNVAKKLSKKFPY